MSRSCFARRAILAAVLSVGFNLPGWAEPVRRDSGSVRLDYSPSERRERIINMLIERGVESPLLVRQAAAHQPEPRKATVVLIPPSASSAHPQLARLLDLIGSAEAGSAGYDAIHFRARILPVKPPTEMTIGEILEWIEETPGQNHAIGRYQIIPMTLNYLVNKESIPLTAIYSAQLQDRLAERLILDAGLPDFVTGLMSSREFMDNLAYVWAGLPLQSGLSAYEGIAGNSATITRRAYEEAFVSIFGAEETRLVSGVVTETLAAAEAARR